MTHSPPKLRFGIYVVVLSVLYGLVFIYTFFTLTNPDMALGKGHVWLTIWAPPFMASLVAGLVTFRDSTALVGLTRHAKDAGKLAGLLVLLGLLVNTSGTYALIAALGPSGTLAGMAIGAVFFGLLVFGLHLLGLTAGYTLSRRTGR